MNGKSERKPWASPDWLLLGATIALILIGLMMVYSSTYPMGYRLENDGAHYLNQQLERLAVGAVAMLLAAVINYRHLMKVSVPGLLAVVVMLVALVIMGKRRQLSGNSISPAEFAKLALVIYLAHWLASKRVEQLHKLPFGLVPFTVIVGAVAALVGTDLSESIVIVLVSLAMFFLAGADWLQLAVGLLGGGAAFGLVFSQLPRATARIQPFLESWRDPLSSTNEQLVQGILALGSGGLFGLGPGNGRMSHRWLPAAHTDSIFAIVGEELGLVGCLVVLGLFAVLAYRGFQIALRAPDQFGRLLSIGVTCWITFQALINVAVVTGSIPYTGIALPFISLGGTQLVTCMAGIGILLSVSRAANAHGRVGYEATDLGRGDGRARVPGPDRRSGSAGS